MSYQGNGTFLINTTGNPVVTGTTISSTAFNGTMQDIANGLSTAITKDGQTTPTNNIPLGSNKITGLGNGTAPTDAAAFGQLSTFGVPGYTTTATAASTTTLVASSTINQFFTGTTTQTVVLPVVSALVLGFQFYIFNISTGDVTVNSSGSNSVATIPSGTEAAFTCVDLMATDASAWDVKFDGFTTETGTGAVVRATGATITGTTLSGATLNSSTLNSPTLVTPDLGVAIATSINKVAITAPATSATLTIADGKTLTASNTLTLAGTDGSSVNFGAGGTAWFATSASQITNSLSGDVSLNNTSNYFDGPSVAQGSTGTWFCSGTVTLLDPSGAQDNMAVKLWDGTTVIASTAVTVGTQANQGCAISLSGYLASPAGNLRISVRDTTTTTGLIKFNFSGNSKDSTITAYRIA